MTLGSRQGLADAVAADRSLPPDDHAVPADIAQWLQALAVLTSVPVEHLVPDPEMLPPESIRFFHVDPDWVAALVAGACSVGRSSSADLKLDAALAARLLPAARRPGPVTGFLLRSAVVDGWPGLEVAAQDAHGGALGTPAPLRMERLAPGLLLYLVDGVLATVEIHEPPEGLHFGVDLRVATKQLRALAGTAPGTQLDVTAPVRFRDEERRVLDVAGTATAIATILEAADDFGAAEFALEMVEGVQSVRFRVDLP
jgi:hypothetical protein